MNVLSIGNSFAQDAHRYLHRIARADGVDLATFNLYIGGCPLWRHFKNMLSEERAYTLEMNGEGTGFNVSMKEALLNREWDIITVQQVSNKSTDYATFQPYLDELVAYVRKCAPKAKIVIHQTWAYEEGSPRLNEFMGYACHEDMFKDIKIAYETAEKAIGAAFTIPSGQLFNALYKKGIEKIHRDPIHASRGLGRYALGLLWYAVLTGNDVTLNTFADFDEEIPENEILIAKQCVAEICGIK